MNILTKFDELCISPTFHLRLLYRSNYLDGKVLWILEEKAEHLPVSGYQLCICWNSLSNLQRKQAVIVLGACGHVLSCVMCTISNKVCRRRGQCNK